MANVSTLSAIDYCIFIAVISGSFGIGVFTYFKKTNKTPESFLMGNRTFGCVSVALSLLTSFISSLDILGFSGEAYAFGLQLSTSLVGASFGILASRILILPVIYPLQLTSANEYLELRFRSKKLRLIASFITAIKIFIFMGIALYAPAIALASATRISWLVYTIVMGLVVTIYSSIGGLRAVIYADVFQVTVMLSGLTVIVLLGYSNVGGFVNAIITASEGGRLELFNMTFGLYERHTFINTFILGFVYNVARYGVSQANIQRLCAVRTIEDANTCLTLNIVGLWFTFFLVFSGGIISYVAYVGCDPLQLGIIQKMEESFTYFIVDRLSYIPGLSGLFLSTLIGGGLSSVSSMINCLVAIVWKDLLINFKSFSELSPKSAARLNILMSFVIGGLVIGMAILSSLATSLMQYTLSVIGIVFGALFGVFILGLFFPKCNAKGAYAGIIFSAGFLAWIYVGARMYKKRPKPLPFSVDDCVESSTVTNTNSTNFVFDSEEISTADDEFQFPLMALYSISYTLYPAIGTITCIVVGVIVSFLTGNDDLNEVPIKCISPFVRKFYWSKAEIRYQMHILRSQSIPREDIFDMQIPGRKWSYMSVASNPYW